MPILGDNVGLLDGHGISGLNAAINRYNEILAKFTEATPCSDLSTVYLLGGKEGFNSANQVFNALMTDNMPDGSLSLEPLGYSNEEGALVSLPPYTIESLARSDIAYRYALVHLNPFAVLGADYRQFNQNGELELYDLATGQGQLTIDRLYGGGNDTHDWRRAA